MGKDPHERKIKLSTDSKDTGLWDHVHKRKPKLAATCTALSKQYTCSSFIPLYTSVCVHYGLVALTGSYVFPRHFQAVISLPGAFC